MTVGIGITTHNRREVLLNSLKNFERFLPDDYKLVVIDDASDVPVPKSEWDLYDIYRFEENAGIATAKNKCLELLEGCEHIFLFDDDTHPISERWWKPYVLSSETHLMYIYMKAPRSPAKILAKKHVVSYSTPRGAMLYIERETLFKAGGLNPNFGRWGFEHKDWSSRIHNKGLTTFRYQDVEDSHKLIFSLDQKQSVAPTVSVREQQTLLNRYRPTFNESQGSTDFYDWRT